MNLPTNLSRWRGSGATSRCPKNRLLGIFPRLSSYASRLTFHALLWPLGSIFRSSLLAIRDTHRVQRPSNNMVADTGQIFDAPSPNQHDGVFLQIVSHSWNIRRDFHAIGQTHPRDFAER